MKLIVTCAVAALLLLGIEANSDWWKTMSLYQVYPRSFMDSDGDGIGDLNGVRSKLQHLVDSGINAFWLSPIYPSPMVDFGYDITDFKGVDPMFGKMEDFEKLVAEAHNLSLKVIMDFVPNHSSDQHEWFQKSVNKIEPYTNYFIWNEGKIVNGTRMPPNNWLSIFRGSAWQWNKKRQAYYFHQFTPQQPDFNFRNPLLVEEIKNILRFWMDKGVDGFRIDAIPHLFEEAHLKNEPVSGWSKDPEEFLYLNHIYTSNLIENYDMVSQWRKVTEEYEKTGNTRVIMVEAYANSLLTAKYYNYGAHFPFNFGFISAVNGFSNSKAFKRVIDNWTKTVPKGHVSNWVPGNHDKSRLVSRFGAAFAPAITTMVQLLPGVAVTYYGDEIGMADTVLSWEETVDPQGCNAGKDKFKWWSRDPSRTPFQWDNSANAGFSTNASTWLRVNNNYKTVNLAAEKQANKSYYKTFVKLSQLRKWNTIKFGNLTTKVYDNDVFAFSRELKDNPSVYVLVNFANSWQSINLKVFDNVPEKISLYHSTSYENVNIGGSTVNPIRLPPRCATIVHTKL